MTVKQMVKCAITQTTLGDYAHEIIHQNYQKIVKQEKPVLKDKDPEPLHQMRVEMRRLRTILWVFDAAIALPINIANVAKVSKSLGKTRDFDVLYERLVNHYYPGLSAIDQDLLRPTLVQIQHLRRKSFRQLQRTLEGDHYQQIKQSLKHWLEEPAYTTTGRLLVWQILPDLLLPLICRLFMHPGWTVSELTPETSPTLHDLRKCIKGVRYQAEFFKDFYGEQYLRAIAEFRDIQELLGQLQDAEVLEQVLAAYPKPQGLSAQISAEKSAFWQKWQPIKSRYLSMEFRQEMRSLLIPS
jgi:CHAD domain-containing protein